MDNIEIEKKEKVDHLLFLAAVILFWLSQYAFVPYFTPHLNNTLGIPAAMVGSIVGAYGLLQTCLRIPIGIVGDRFAKHVPIILLGNVALVIGGFILLATESPNMLWLARACAGVGAASWVAYTVFYSQRFSSSGNHRTMGRMVSANNLGMLLAYVIGALLFDHVGIRPLFVISGISGLLAVLIILFSYKRLSTGQIKPKAIPQYSLVIKSKNLWLCSGLTALSQLISFATMISFSANYAMSIGCTGTQVGLLSITNTVAGFVASSSIASGKLDKIKQKYLVAFGFFTLFIYCLFVPKCTGILGLLVLQFLGGMGRAFIMSFMMAGATSEVPSELRATAMGVFQSVYGLGMTLGPIIMGSLLGSMTGYAGPFMVIAVISVLGVICCLIPQIGNRFVPKK